MSELLFHPYCLVSTSASTRVLQSFPSFYVCVHVCYVCQEHGSQLSSCISLHFGLDTQSLTTVALTRLPTQPQGSSCLPPCTGIPAVRHDALPVLKSGFLGSEVRSMAGYAPSSRKSVQSSNSKRDFSVLSLSAFKWKWYKATVISPVATVTTTNLVV